MKKESKPLRAVLFAGRKSVDRSHKIYSIGDLRKLGDACRGDTFAG